MLTEMERQQAQIEAQRKARALKRAQAAQEKTLLQGFDVDEDSDKSVADQLRDALSQSSTRVIELFRDWDDDGNGMVSKEEFRKAMGLLGFNVPAKDIDALFDSWDPDGSGVLSLDELRHELRDHKTAARIAEFKAKEAKRQMLLQGLDIDEDSEKSVAEQLREALAKSAVRVIDLFNDWDTDGNGKISKEEFRKAMGLLGFNVPAKDIDALFDSWDPDGSGVLLLGELDRQLSEEKAQIEAQRKARALKRAQAAQEKTLLQGFDVDEDSDKSVADQLRDALSQSSTRVIELFRDWDDDGNGMVSKEEFHKAMGLLGFNVPAKDIDALFDSWDPDGSCVLSLDELRHELRDHKTAARIAEFKAKEAKRQMLLQGLDIDEDSEKSVAEQLREALAKSAVRVIDLFNDWDTDGNGKISKEEFRKAMGLLGFNVPAKDIDALFDSWDPDGSGVLSLGELDKQLSEHKAQIEAQRKARALKRAQAAQEKTLLQGFDVDEDSDKSVADQLRDALSQSSTRVIELFRDWDDDGNGMVSKEEFRKAMGLLGFNVPAKDIDALFDSWDPDGSGVLSLGELRHELRDHKTAARIAEFKAKEAKEAKKKSLLRGLDIDEDSEKSVAEQLREALAKSAVRVIDLFNDWDTDGNGKISKEEFRKAMGLLGFNVPAKDIDALFDSWDPDGSGVLSLGELDKQLSEHKAQIEAQRKARALKRAQSTSVKRLEDGEADEAAARIAAVRKAQAERRERAAVAAARQKSKELADAALAAEKAAAEAAAREAAEAARRKWRRGLQLQKEVTRRKLAAERRMLAAAAEAAAKLEEEAAEAETAPARPGQLGHEPVHSYVVKGHGWQWSAELGCLPAPAGPPLWTAAQAEAHTAQANTTAWKPKVATTASLFHDVSTAQLPPSHSPTAPRVPVPPAALTPTKEASPRARRRGVNAVYLKQVRAHSRPKLALNHL